MATISFNNHKISPNLKLTSELKYFLISVFITENIVLKSLSYIFCTDEYLLALNQRYLNHDTLTDILTFTLSEHSAPIIAEIYISIERVQENAVTLKTSYAEELLRVMIHGILHLCGYPDGTIPQKKIMRKKENLYLSRVRSTWNI